MGAMSALPALMGGGSKGGGGGGGGGAPAAAAASDGLSPVNTLNFIDN